MAHFKIIKSSYGSIGCKYYSSYSHVYVQTWHHPDMLNVRKQLFCFVLFCSWGWGRTLRDGLASDVHAHGTCVPGKVLVERKVVVVQSLSHV